MTETTFTEREFLDQVVEFRKLMGEKSFWAKPETTRLIAQQALGHAYLFLEKVSQETINRCAALLDSTLSEYSRRELMLIRMGEKIGK